MRHINTLLRFIRPVGAKRKALSALTIGLVSLVAVACGGTGVDRDAEQAAADNGAGGGTNIGGGAVPEGEDALQQVDFSLIANVMGSQGSGTLSVTSESRGISSTLAPAESKVARLIKGVNNGRKEKSGTGEMGSGVGGKKDIVDAKGNNLNTAGLDNAVDASITFIAEGSENELGRVTFNGEAANVDVGGKELGAGQNLIVQVTTSLGTTRAVIPATLFNNGGTFGFNAVLLNDGAMVLEIFPDSNLPLGESDNGTRVIVDTKVDCFQDGNFSTVSRLETPDGMIFYDSNLDGNFGSPSDACILFDTNGDGMVTPSDLPVAYAVDPNLDGTTSEGEERLLGNNIPEDFINGVDVAFAPANPVANGLSTVTLGVDFLAAPNGSPIGASIELTLGFELDGDTDSPRLLPLSPSAGGGWVANEQSFLTRTLDTNNPGVTLLSGGSIRLLEAFRVPVLSEDGVLKVQLRYARSDDPEGTSTTIDIPLRANSAPILSSVAFMGATNSPNNSGLENSSRQAHLVEGNPIEIVGQNFSNDPLLRPMVTFGGVPAVVTDVNSDGTRIFTNIPAGAVSGPIAVVQNGVGAQTSESFIVGGMPLRLRSVLPADQSTNVGVNSPIILRFNRPISAAGVENGFLIETSSGVFVPGNTLVSEDGLTLTHIPNQDLAGSSSYVVSLTSAMQTPEGVRYDDNVGDGLLPDALTKVMVSSFQTAATPQSDMIAPNFDELAATLNAPSAPELPFTITLPFSEAISPGTLFASANPTSADSLRLRSDMSGNLVGMMVTDINESGEVVTLTVLGELKGRQSYTLELSPSITDIVGNALVGSTSRNFTTAMRIDRQSAVSGTELSRIVIEGSTFANGIGNVQVTFAGESARIPATIIEATESAIELEVPVGAIDGPFELTVAGQTILSSRPFVVTASGYDPRVIAEAAGAFGIDVDVDGRAIVSYQGSGEVGFLDIPSERELMTLQGSSKLQIGGVPTEAKLNRSGTLGFTTNYGNAAMIGESVFVIDTNSRAVLSTIPVGRRPTRLALSPDDRRLYVTNYLDDTISVIDLSSLAVIYEIKTGAGPNGVTIAPDNAYGYVANYLENTVTAFDTVSFKIRGQIVVGENPARVLISPDASEVFVTNFGSNTITVIDANTLKIKQTIDGLFGPSAMVFDPNGERFFVTNRLSNTIQEVVKSGNEWALSELKIATENVPAGLVITSDGSLLAYTTEGAGKVSVITVGDPRLTISGLRVDQEGVKGPETFSADAGRRIWVEGRGFGANIGDLTVKLGNVDLTKLATDFSSSQVLVQIPSNAHAGPLTVSRERNGEDILSNDIPLLITGQSPQVLTATPGDGSRGVPRDSTIVIEMSEPLDLSSIFRADGEMLTGQSGKPVLRVVRLDDEGGESINMSGTWSADAFGRRFEFNRPLVSQQNLAANGKRQEFFQPGSNNTYEIVVSPNVRDLFGNQVVGAVTSFGNESEQQLGSVVTQGNEARKTGFRARFVTDDQRGPRIQKAFFRDIDGNGPDEGDEIELEFDEDLKYNSANFDQGSMDLLGRVNFTNGAPGNTLRALPGSNPQRVVMTLGAGTSLNFGANGTTINAGSAETPNSISQFTDYSNQRPTTGSEIRIQVDPRFDNNQAPRMLFASWDDRDGLSSVNAGDHLVLYFNEPVRIGGAASVAGLVNITNGSLANASIVARVAGDDYRQVRILLAAGDTLVPTTSSVELIDAGNAFVGANTIFDLLGNAAHAGTASAAIVSDLAPTTPTMSTATKPLHIDVEGTPEGLSEGDVIIISFSAPVLVNRNAGDATPGSRFKLGVDGDRFGFGARIGQPAFVTPRGQAPRLIASNEIVIVLGKQPVLTFTGDFGVDVNE